MNIVTTQRMIDVFSTQSVEVVFQLIDFLRTSLPNGPGWTVAGSGDGVSAGGDGVDVITTSDDLLDADAWIVMEDPDSNLQILFEKVTTTNWNTFINPSADYSGGTATTIPTSGGGTSFQTFGSSIAWGDDVNGVATILADSDAPYGFALIGFEYGRVSANSAIALIPIDDANRNTDFYNYLFLFGDDDGGTMYSQLMITNANTGLTATRFRSPNLAVSGINTVIGLSLKDGTSGGTFVGLASSESGFSGIPIVWIDTSEGYYGTSTFMQWSFMNNNFLATFDSKTRLIVGEVIFPWDGTTTPKLSI